MLSVSLSNKGVMGWLNMSFFASSFSQQPYTADGKLVMLHGVVVVGAGVIGSGVVVGAGVLVGAGVAVGGGVAVGSRGFQVML